MLSAVKKFYWFAAMFFLVAWLWLLFNLQQSSHFTICFFKKITGIPCPSCGITRSIISILSQNWDKAFHYNPLGYLAIILMTILPIWIIRDLLGKSSTLYNCFIKFESFVKYRSLPTAIGIFIILINWACLIFKVV